MYIFVLYFIVFLNLNLMSHTSCSGNRAIMQGVADCMRKRHIPPQISHSIQFNASAL